MNRCTVEDGRRWYEFVVEMDGIWKLPKKLLETRRLPDLDPPSPKFNNLDSTTLILPKVERKHWRANAEYSIPLTLKQYNTLLVSIFTLIARHVYSHNSISTTILDRLHNLVLRPTDQAGPRARISAILSEINPTPP